MNVCQLCGEPATVHLTDIVNKKRRDTHMCEQCARDQNILPATNEPQINLAGLIQALMQQSFNAPPGEEGETVSAPDPSLITCSACGIKYAQFRADGRLGCPADYDAFETVLTPLLERVHRGLVHRGKSPHGVRHQRHASEVAELRRLLTEAVASENYEEAARLRDRLRQKEAAE